VRYGHTLHKHGHVHTRRGPVISLSYLRASHTHVAASYRIEIEIEDLKMPGRAVSHVPATAARVPGTTGTKQTGAILAYWAFLVTVASTVLRFKLLLAILSWLVSMQPTIFFENCACASSPPPLLAYQLAPHWLSVAPVHALGESILATLSS
jgi:hypothetical protein